MTKSGHCLSTEKSCLLSRISLRLLAVSHWLLAFTTTIKVSIFCSQSVLEMAHREKKLVADSTKTYSRHCFLRDVPYMTRYHYKIFLRIASGIALTFTIIDIVLYSTNGREK